ncbi:MAG: DUF3667 domain-containing protein [Bacteroidota bacterium]
MVRDYSTWNFLKLSFGSLTNLDGKVFRSFWFLLIRPGYLPRVYLDGRRQPYMRPIQLFLIANLVYFLVQPLTIFNTFNNTLTSHMTRQVYSEGARLADLVNEEVDAREIPFEQFEALFNQKSTTYAKSFVLMIVPLFALFLYAAFGRTRRYYVEHLVFSTHFFAFLLFFVFSLFLFLYSLGYQLTYQFLLGDLLNRQPEGSFLQRFVQLTNEHITTPIFIAYFYLAARRFYAESRISCLLKSLVLNFAMLYVIYTYRFLLFWMTFYSI